MTAWITPSASARVAAALLVVALAGCAKPPDHARDIPASRTPAGAAGDDSLSRAERLVGTLELQALGTEPFWSVAITWEGIVYADPEHTAGVRFPYVAPRWADSTLVFETARADSTPRALRIAIRRGACSDGMSDQRYRYTAEVRRDGVALRGCARFRPAGAR